VLIVERVIDTLIFLASIYLALLFFAIFSEKWLDKELVKRSKRIKKQKDYHAGVFDEWD